MPIFVERTAKSSNFKRCSAVESHPRLRAVTQGGLNGSPLEVPITSAFRSQLGMRTSKTTSLVRSMELTCNLQPYRKGSDFHNEGDFTENSGLEFRAHEAKRGLGRNLGSAKLALRNHWTP